jgi:hypothetical protein
LEATATPAPTTGNSVPQHLQALERANRVRLARADLKRSIANGDVPVTKVITECPWETRTMTLSELLRRGRPCRPVPLRSAQRTR